MGKNIKQFCFVRTAADAANSCIAIPFDGIRSIHLEGGNTALKIQFEGDDNAEGSVIMTITAGKFLEVVKAIVNSQRAGGTGFITIADDISSPKQYIHADLTAAGTIDYQA